MTKVCDIWFKKDEKNRCYYILQGCYSDDEFNAIINYSSWEFKSWKTGKEIKTFASLPLPFEYNYRNRIFWSYIGFATIMIRYLQKIGYIINGKENFYSKNIIIGSMYYKLWDFQEEAVKGWIDNSCCGIIKSPTGSGKSILGCNIIKRTELRTIIVVHTSDIMINVWYNNLVEQFSEGIKGRIGLIGGGIDKKDRLDMRLSGDCSFEYNIDKDIVIATFQSLLNKLDLLSKEKFGLVIYDEVHHVSAEQFKKVADNIRATYLLGLSATLSRPDGKSPLFYGMLGGLCYNVGIKKLVNKGILVEPIFEAIVLNDPEIQIEIASCGKKQLELSQYIKKLSSSSAVKKNYIIDLVKGLTLNKKRFIMYTDWVNPIDGIFTRDDYVRELRQNGIRVVGVASEFSGTYREKLFNDLKKGELDGLVFGALGSEGINIPVIDSVIMCNCTASPIRYPQRVGRAMRSLRDGSKTHAYIYEILIDIPMEHDWANRNFYEYKSEGYRKRKTWIDNGKVINTEI
jgi:superfamily II DNA or RNA helicase